jgi:hypothetical protein
LWFEHESNDDPVPSLELRPTGSWSTLDGRRGIASGLVPLRGLDGMR